MSGGAGQGGVAGNAVAAGSRREQQREPSHGVAGGAQGDVSVDLGDQAAVAPALEPVIVLALRCGGSGAASSASAVARSAGVEAGGLSGDQHRAPLQESACGQRGLDLGSSVSEWASPTYRMRRAGDSRRA